MRPLELSMTAFGPFKDEEIIDFTKLGDNPLFLINGQTGSGKSTILDGICYALYGETTGNEREGSQMRCDYSDPSTLTTLSLKFQLGDKQYLINRTPSQERPKKKGEGMVEEKSSASLYYLDGEEQHLIAGPKVTEVYDAITNITSLTAEQFRQVMVLPQGKFVELLTASSQDREAIFEKLFETNIYSKLQDNLKKQAANIKGRLDVISQEQTGMLKGYEIDDNDSLDEEITTLTSSLKELDINRGVADTTLADHKKQIQEAKTVDALFKAQHAEVESFAKLSALKPENNKNTTQLEQAKKAKEITPLYIELNKNKKVQVEINRTISTEKKILDEVDTALTDIEKEQKKAPTHQKRIEAITAQITELQKIEVRVNELDKARNKCAITKQDKVEADTVLNTLKIKIEQIKTELEEVNKKHKDGLAAVSLLPEKRQALNVKEEQGVKLKEYTTAESAHDKLLMVVTTLKKSRDKADIQYKKDDRSRELIELAWNNGQAAILADKLKDGDPCLVCGSLEHPSKASCVDTLPTPEEREDATELANKSRDALEVIKQESAVKEAEIKASQGALDTLSEKIKEIKNIALDERQADYRKCKEEIKRLETSEVENKKLELTINHTTSAIKQNEVALDQAQSQATEKGTVNTIAQTNLNNKLEGIPKKYKVKETLLSELENLNIECQTLKTRIEKSTNEYQSAREKKSALEAGIKTHEKQKSSTDKEVETNIQKWEKALVEHGFIDETCFNDKLMDKKDEAELEHAIRKYEDDLVVVKGRLDEKTMMIKGKKQIDIAMLETEEKVKSEYKEKCDQDYHISKQRFNSIVKLKEQLVSLNIEKNSLEKDYGVIGHLSNVANGNNAHRVSIQRFVLSVLLDDVLMAANHRLLEMSRGRYELFRNEKLSDGRTQSGLDIIVEDNYSNRQRPAETLSGGESFQAALALALGLSEVVQSYSGGIRLDTLFIDEGFGSLDADSLDMAINVLLELKDSGRMVGIISHVEELKQMINVRLDVKSDHGVSQTSMVVT